ncbi:MAG: formate dehydrogenase accessory sulfurtransferase FdhD, partial [Tunicatimonas sp.]|uniref:formate dehydrogenase accessory sulfurtransferase FdhD n=1 Tax=Tunicatimonas sp. TaxID=1940096 RepID=UPI003C784AF4
EFGPTFQRETRDLSVTMRTPGHDFELALGFLYTEGIIRNADDIINIRYCPSGQSADEAENVVRVSLSSDLPVDWQKLQRHFYTTSSCGICGKTSIEAIQAVCPTLTISDLSVSQEVIHQAPAKLREAQLIFEYTGGLHAAGLFSQAGELLLWREDIGRHNALDKLIGAALSQSEITLTSAFILLSGRISFELVQKTLIAGVPLLAAVGAPSGLAVQLAQQYNLGLIGFVRNQRFNIYHGHQRLLLAQPTA